MPRKLVSILLFNLLVILTAAEPTPEPEWAPTGRLSQFRGFVTPYPPPLNDADYMYASVWASWSAWSFCSNGVRIRVRACNTVKGFSCLGPNQETTTCWPGDPAMMPKTSRGSHRDGSHSDYDVVDPYEDDRKEAYRQLYTDDDEVPSNEKLEKLQNLSEFRRKRDVTRKIDPHYAPRLHSHASHNAPVMHPHVTHLAPKLNSRHNLDRYTGQTHSISPLGSQLTYITPRIHSAHSMHPQSHVTPLLHLNEDNQNSSTQSNNVARTFSIPQAHPLETYFDRIPSYQYPIRYRTSLKKKTERQRTQPVFLLNPERELSSTGMSVTDSRTPSPYRLRNRKESYSKVWLQPEASTKTRVIYNRLETIPKIEHGTNKSAIKVSPSKYGKDRNSRLSISNDADETITRPPVDNGVNTPKLKEENTTAFSIMETIISPVYNNKTVKQSNSHKVVNISTLPDSDSTTSTSSEPTKSPNWRQRTAKILSTYFDPLTKRSDQVQTPKKQSRAIIFRDLPQQQYTRSSSKSPTPPSLSPKSPSTPPKSPTTPPSSVESTKAGLPSRENVDYHVRAPMSRRLRELSTSHLPRQQAVLQNVRIILASTEDAFLPSDDFDLLKPSHA